MMPMIRTLGLAWIAALVAAAVAAGLLAAALLWPPPLAAPGWGETRADRGLQAEIFGALTAAEGARMREDLRGLAAQLPPAGRMRLEQILAAEEQRLEAAPPALVLSSFAARLEAAVQGMQPSGLGGVMPGPAPALLQLAAAAGLVAALLAILAAPLALAPLRAAGGPSGWAGRRDLWGALGRAMAEARPIAAPTALDPSASAEFAQLRAEAQANLAMLRTEADATRRSLREMTAEGAKLGRTAEAAEGRLARVADGAERAVDQLGQLPHLAAAQSAGIEALAARVERASGQAERAAALLAPMLDMAAATQEAGAMEALSLRLESAAERLAQEAGTAPEAFRDALAEALGPLVEAAAALPHQAGAVAAEVAGLTAMAERLEACGRSLPESLADQAAALASVLADQRAAVADLEAAATAGARLDALARHLPEVAERLEGRTTELMSRLGDVVETGEARLGAAVDRLDGGIAAASARLDAGIAAASARLDAGIAAASEQLDAGTAEAAGSLEAALAVLPARLEAGIDAGMDRLDLGAAAATERLGARLAAVAARLEEGVDAATGGLSGRMAEATGRLEAGIGAATDQLGAGMDALTGRVGAALARWPAMLERASATAERQEQTAAHLAHLAELLSGAARERETALARLFEAMPTLAARQEAAGAELSALAARFREDAEGHLERLERLPALGSVAGASHRGEAEDGSDTPSVAARLLRQLDPMTATPAVTETLCRLDGVETEVARLLREAELIAGRSGAEPAAPLPRDMIERTPELLESLDATIRRLQSVATAIAIASDGSRRSAMPGPARDRLSASASPRTHAAA